ncbi:hypothetical protein D3C72_1136850 [compost metagenome]
MKRSHGERDTDSCVMLSPGVNSRQVPLQPRSNSSALILRKPMAGSATHTQRDEIPYTTT